VAQQVIHNYNYALALVPSDTVNSPQKNNRAPDALWVGGAGIVAAVLGDGNVAQFTVVAGTLLPFSCPRVNASVTTATLILGLWQL
jgi:hypothetical protein